VLTERSTEIRTHNISVLTLLQRTVDWCWFSKEGWTIAPDCPLGVFGDFGGLISICFTLEEFGDNLEALSTKISPLLIEAIFCLEDTLVT